MQLPEVQHLEDPENQSEEPTTRPLAMALRNSAAALFGIGLFGGAFLMKMHLQGDGGPVWWWPWGAAAAFVVVICFTHAFIGSLLGGRAAAAVLKVVVALALAAMLFAVWWSVQPKEGAH